MYNKDDPSGARALHASPNQFSQFNKSLCGPARRRSPGAGKACGLLTAALLAGASLGSGGSVNAATISVVPVAGQQTDFFENAPGSVQFQIINGSIQDPLKMFSAVVGFSPVDGGADDLASNPKADQSQCQNIPAFDVKTKTPGVCTITVTFDTTDKDTAKEDADISHWKLGVIVTVTDLTHPTNTIDPAPSSVVVGVKDLNLPEPASTTLCALGIVLIAIGCARRRRRGLVREPARCG